MHAERAGAMLHDANKMYGVAELASIPVGMAKTQVKWGRDH